MRLLALALIIGCDDKETTDDTDTTDTTADWILPDGGTVTLTTRDGVDLVGDYYPADVAGSPGVVLLHMIPPSWDRTSWPDDFISALSGAGYSVLAIDRRGAGDSGGNAEDAYEGEWGRYDVEAAASLLAADGYSSLAVIGASNGTTSAIDYAIWAGGEGLPVPAVIGLMTGGGYTEAQTDMSNFAALSIPTILTYSTDEREWSVEQEPLNPGSWSFMEYAAGAHGTQMFNAAPEVSDDLLAYLGEHL
ncbi:MAG: pimeloyl-ACP methyl ester carboxylesterase [Myxococcota bacterium]|jgi:pimeloyl-ACP methyl ester carboxylesterase